MKRIFLALVLIPFVASAHTAQAEATNDAPVKDSSHRLMFNPDATLDVSRVIDRP